MNILVCIKQVPDTTIIKIDPETNTLMREGVPAIVSPFDAYALEAAARIKDKDKDTKIVVLSMGPEQALAALKECLSVGGDKAYLVLSLIHISTPMASRPRSEISITLSEPAAFRKSGSFFSAPIPNWQF